MDGSFYTALARLMPPEFLVLVVIAVFVALLWHLRECSKRRKDIYERMGKSERLLHRIAGRLGVDDTSDD